MNVRVDVVVSGPVGVATVGSNAVMVAAGSTAVAGTISLSSDQRTLTFVPSSLLAVSTTYTVSVSGFTDQAGNAVVPFSSSFTTGTSGVADTSAPTVQTVSPANGASGVAVNSSVVLTFNKNIDPSTVNNTTITVADNAFTGVLAGSYTVNGAVVTFTPATVMRGGATIQVAVNPGPSDLAGNRSAVFFSTFTAAAVADTTAPQVVSVTPGNGATGIGLNATVVLTFSKSLNPNTITTNNFGLLANGNKLGVSLSHSADNRVVTLSAGALPAASTMAVFVTSGVTDLSNNALTNFQSLFTTALAFDTTHASVVSQRPGFGATGVPVNIGVVLYISEPVNAATISGALHISQSGLLVNGTTQVTNSGRVIQFTPSAAFQNGALVQVFLDSTALDADGNSLTNYQGSFTTALNTATIAPAVMNTSPSQNSVNIPTNVVIDVGFNETLNPTTVDTTTVSLLQGSSTVASTVSVVGGGAVIQITPSAPLAANTSYSVSITTGVQGTNGLALTFSGTYLTFRTGAGADTVNPNVVIVSPPNGAVNVGDNAGIRVHFSKVVNPLTVNGSTMAVSSGGGTQVPYAVSFTTNQDVSITPFSPLPDATQTTIAIAGVTDVAGNPVQPRLTTHFTTGNGPDLATPVVVNVNPSNGATAVPLNAVIQAQANKPLDPGRVSSTTLTITDNITRQVLAGTYSVSSDGLTISFLPSALLTATRNYTVSGGGITDLVGNFLPGPNFSFTTGTATSTSAPQVVGTSPSNGTTAVPINAQVVIQFNEPVDSLTVNQVTLSSSGGAVTVTRSLTNGNQMLVLVPLAPLSVSTSYTVTIAGVQDMSGNALAASVTASFITGTGADLTPPSVTSVNPANGATGVLTHATIQGQFSKQIDPFTVTNSTFIVFLSSNGQPVAGTINVSANGLTATFTPTAPLSVSTAYRVSVSASDLEGQSLFFSSSFTTGTQ